MAATPIPLSAVTSRLTETPRSLPEMIEKYSIMEAVFRAFGATVPGDTLIAQVLADLRAVQLAGADEMLTQDEAAAETGLSKRTLVRQAEAGKIRSTGRNRNRTYRRGDLCAKPGYVPPARRATAGAATASQPGVASIKDAAHDLMTDARRVAELARKGGKSA